MLAIPLQWAKRREVATDQLAVRKPGMSTHFRVGLTSQATNPRGKDSCCNASSRKASLPPPPSPQNMDTAPYMARCIACCCGKLANAE